MAAPLIVRLIMDAAGYLKTQDTVVSSNTRQEASTLRMGDALQVASIKSVQASLRTTEALQTQVAGYRELAASATQSAKVRTRANLLADRSQARLNSSLGLSSTAFAGSSRAVKTGEKDLGKFTRGALAGSGAASSLGRSLAFASTGFIAIAGGATLISASIKAAIDLQKTQRQVDQQLKTGGKSWIDYGQQIEQADLRLSHVSGFTNQELLQSFTGLFRVTNNVSRSLQLNAVAADVARGRNIGLTSASNALAKAAAGSFSSLRKLNIIVPQGSTVLQALTFVAQKYAGQAAAGATVGDKFHAALVNTEETIGTALLPAFTRATTAITDWLAKMNESGKAQHDLNELVTVGSTVFHTLGDAIGVVDKITGSFGKTLRLIIGVWLGREIVKVLIGVDKLAASWLGVAGAANTAAAAEERATAAGAGAGAAAGAGVAGAEAGAGGSVLLGGLAARRAAQQAEQSAALRARVAAFTPAAEEGVAAIGGAAVVASSKVAALRTGLTSLSGITIAAIGIPIVLNIENRLRSPISRGLDSVFGHGQTSAVLRDFIVPHSVKDFLGVSAFNDIFKFQSEATKKMLAGEKVTQDLITKNLQRGLKTGTYVSPTFQPGGQLGRNLRQFNAPPGSPATGTGPFGKATPIAVYTKYTQTITEQLAVAQAALTKTTKDDVAAAKRIIARIKRLIDQGHLQGTALVQALQDEATQQGVLDNARQNAAAQAAKIAAAKQAAASSYTTPIDLQLAEARAQLTKSTADDIRVEKQILAAAKAAIASGKKNKKGDLVALQIELQAKQALESLTSQTAQSTFTLPAKLQLALARDAALGIDPTKDLLKAKAALLKFISTHKKNFAALTDAYNQLAGINQQLGSSVTGILGNFKQASTAALTAGLGLTPAQRKALRARLSQLGPGGTVPGKGVGAGGFIIGADGRPIQVHQHRQPGHGRTADAQTVSPARFNHLLRVLERTANRPLHVTVDLDGRVIADSTTRHQERHNKRNPHQRRGPNAG